MAYLIADETSSRAATELDIDEGAVDVLADRRRRLVLECLEGCDVPLALADIAREVAERESDAALADVSGDRLRRIRIDLYHVHLPKLDDAGVVAFDADERTVRTTATAADR